MGETEFLSSVLGTALIASLVCPVGLSAVHLASLYDNTDTRSNEWGQGNGAICAVGHNLQGISFSISICICSCEQILSQSVRCDTFV